MLRSLKGLIGYNINAVDGDFGNVNGFYFDDETWIIRYLLVNTNKWLPGRTFLISPQSLKKLSEEKNEFNVKLTKKQIEQSPRMEQDKPVSRQHEIELSEYYGWQSYWIGAGAGYVPGTGLVSPPVPARPENELRQLKRQKDQGDPHLRSSQEVIGYQIHSKKNKIGHVEDIIADTESWILRYIVIDTRNWLPGGKKVIVAIPWIERIDWSSSEVYVDLLKEDIENAPEFEDLNFLNRQYENSIYDHYRKIKYWE